MKSFARRKHKKKKTTSRDTGDDKNDSFPDFFDFDKNSFLAEERKIPFEVDGDEGEENYDYGNPTEQVKEKKAGIEEPRTSSEHNWNDFLVSKTQVRDKTMSFGDGRLVGSGSPVTSDNDSQSPSENENSSKYWRTKYRNLKTEYDSVSRNYTTLLKQKQMKDAENAIKIQSLEKKLHELEKAALQPSTSPEFQPVYSSATLVDEERLAKAEKKIIRQSEEIQKLLEQRIIAENQISEMRAVVESNEQLASLFSNLKEKESVINSLQGELTALQHNESEIKISTLVRADSSPAEKCKKKKGWWGMKYKPSRKRILVTPNQLLKSPIGSNNYAESYPQGQLSQLSLGYPDENGSQPQESSRKTSNQDMALISSLENQIESLQKEKDSLNQKLRINESQLEIMSSSLRVQSIEAQTQEAKSQLPLTSSQDVESLQLLVEAQAKSLRNLSFENQKLETSLRAFKHTEERSEQSVRELARSPPPIDESNSMPASSQKAEIEELRSKLNLYEKENSRLRQTLKNDMVKAGSDLSRISNRSEKYAAIVGNLMKRIQSLQLELATSRKQLTDQIRKSHEENLLSNRVSDSAKKEIESFRNRIGEVAMPMRRSESLEKNVSAETQLNSPAGWGKDRGITPPAIPSSTHSEEPEMDIFKVQVVQRGSQTSEDEEKLFPSCPVTPRKPRMLNKGTQSTYKSRISQLAPQSDLLQIHSEASAQWCSENRKSVERGLGLKEPAGIIVKPSVTVEPAIVSYSVGDSFPLLSEEFLKGTASDDSFSVTSADKNFTKDVLRKWIAKQKQLRLHNYDDNYSR